MQDLAVLAVDDIDDPSGTEQARIVRLTAGRGIEGGAIQNGRAACPFTGRLDVDNGDRLGVEL
ncbi:MAG: hypothetical protein LC753_03915 [Acidobacteria bacterium]|nr:hypothetical protein [Acidobacteriota bacterium]MCA1649445.1 hypothetical protein [Acidobacteriota bacterium]